MNQELMNMVEQAINSIPDHVDFDIPDVFKEAFAALVAAAEREACAGICDRFQMRDVGMQPAECAGAIRARGETK